VDAGSVVGGAAGGAVATLCGAVCAGAVASATANLVRNGLNGTVDPVGLAAETVAGGVTGGVLGAVVPRIATSVGGYYNTVKGNIGEGLSELGLNLTGQGIASRNFPTGFGKSNFDFELTDGTYVESKFGTSVPQGQQAAAVAAYGDLVDVQSWTYPIVSGIGAAGATAGASDSTSPGSTAGTSGSAGK
jgi:hypothetical protein